MPNSTIAEALVEAAQTLRRAGVPDARLDAGVLLSHVLGRDRTFVITNADAEVGASDLARFRAIVERRSDGMPVQYLTGHQEFFKLDFLVTPDVLIPRPETELLVEAALELIDSDDASQRICDVGTGSGCIVISLLHERPRARGVALDISAEALAVAWQNARRHGVEDRLSLVESDCFESLERSRDVFSLITANPPYVPEPTFETLQREVRDYEPKIALTSGDDGLAMLRRLVIEAPPFLQAGGYLLLEVGIDQAAPVYEAVDPAVWDLHDMHLDLQGIFRTIILRKN